MSSYVEDLEKRNEELENKVSVIFNGDLNEYILMGAVERLHFDFVNNNFERFEQTFRKILELNQTLELITWKNLEWICHKIDPTNESRIVFGSVKGEIVYISAQDTITNNLAIGVSVDPVIIKSRWTRAGYKGVANCVNAMIKTFEAVMEHKHICIENLI